MIKFITFLLGRRGQQSFSDLPIREKKKILRGAIHKANEEQAQVIEQYGPLYKQEHHSSSGATINYSRKI